MSAPAAPKHLYLQVLAAIAVGVALGYLAPETAVQLKPLSEGFIRLIKMVIAPIIFCTIVTGIAASGDMKKVGRVGAKALLYFEVLTSLAMIIGLVVAELFQPGAGLHVDPSSLDDKDVQGYVKAGGEMHTGSFLLGMIPESAVEAFAKGDILQVLVFSLLFGWALARTGEKGAPVLHGIEALGKVLFGVVALVMRLAPLGALGAMAFTVGKYGLGSLVALGKLMAAFYTTGLLFVLLVLGAIVRALGLRMGRLLGYLKDELLLVLGTSSSESALPAVMEKLERLGCPRQVVGLTVPMGYSFNLDGTSIYLTLAALFVAQATDTPLTLTHKLGILGVLLLTSKGAAAVTGGGFIALAATLSSTKALPVAGLALLLGVDRFMSEARALVNLVGNAVATLVVSRWEGQLDPAAASAVMERHAQGASTLAPAQQWAPGAVDKAGGGD